MHALYKWLLGLCFFLSGATSLALEVAWSKELSYILGNSLYAMATVVSAFMCGLGLGGWMAGRWGPRVRSPVRLYASIQMIIAVCGMLSIPLFHATKPLFQWMFQTFEPGQGFFLLIRFLTVFVMMCVPVTLMGMTLPIITGAFARRKDTYSFEAGLLYGVNTLGAVAGTLGAGFFLLATLGLLKTCIVAGILDACVGIGAFWIHRKIGKIPDRPDDADKEWSITRKSPSLGRWTMLQWLLGGLFGFSGFMAMVYEVGWFRLLGLTMGPSVYAFSAMLGMFLVGVGLGSTVFSRWIAKTRFQGKTIVAALEILLACAGLLSLYYYNDLPRIYAEFFHSLGAAFGGTGYILAHLGISLIVVLLPCLIMGILFPAAVKALRESGPRLDPEFNIGRLYMLNTFGGILGSLAAGFWMVPRLGMWNSLILASLGSLGIGIAFCFLSQLKPGVRVLVAGTSLFLVIGLAWGSPSWDMALFNLGPYRSLYTKKEDLSQEKHQLIYFSEGINAPVAVFNTDGVGSLRVTGKADASSNPIEMIAQLLIGHLPVFFTEHPSRAAVIGYGCGVSAGAVLSHPEVESADILEIEKAVIDASHYFDSINLDPLDDPRAKLILEDARVFLTYTSKTYDVITSEPSNPWMAGISNLFTTDFYRIVRSRLSPKGIFCNWIQTYEFSEDTFRVILASLKEVFPHVLLFQFHSDSVVLCSLNPICVPWDLFQKRFKSVNVDRSLRRSGIISPHHLLAYFRCAEDGLEELFASTLQRNTDDNVWLEHRAIRELLQMSTTSTQDLLVNRLATMGMDRRLSSIKNILTGLPHKECIREIVSYLHGGEPTYNEKGNLVDSGKTVRSILLEGMRNELAKNGMATSLSSFDQWMQESRNYHSNRFDASQRLTTSLPDSLSQKRFLLDQVLDLAPDLPQVNNAMADFLITDMNDYNAAEPYYRKSSKVPSSPNYYGALINLGHIAALRTLHEKADLWQEAAGFYREAIAWNPFLSRAYLSMAHYHTIRKEWSLAEQALREGLHFIPDSPEILEMLKEVRQKSGKK